MNKPLRRVALAMMAMVLLLMGNVTYVQVFRAEELQNNALNKRTMYDAYSRERGQITAGGQSLARSVPSGDETLQYRRLYPNGPAFAPVTGFYSFHYGSNGIERAQNEILNGTDDRMAFNRFRNVITGKEPAGGNIETTINPAMQQVAYDQLTSKGFEGSVVALRPDTGEILTMANAPSYDPSQISVLDNNEAAANWNQLNNDPGSPMTNRAVSEVYPPGSVFKLITTAAALDNGYTADSQINTAASIPLPNSSAQLPNYGGSTCGGSTLKDAVAYSCNTAFAEIAGELGQEKLRNQAAKFGFGQELEIPMETAASEVGPMSDQAALYQSGIGQRDVRVTPLQNAMMAATIANDGKVMRPQLVKNARTQDMSELQEFQPEELGQAVSKENADTITEMMLASEDNTSGSGKISGVDIASKTGTAQHGDPGDKPHGWYVAFAPAEDPKIAVAVIVENGGDEGAEATGGSIAAPIAREVIHAGLQGGG